MRSPQGQPAVQVPVHPMFGGAGSAGISGASVSNTGFALVWLLVLRRVLVAAQVRVTSWFCGQLPAVVTSAKVSVGLGSQASVAVGVAKLGVAVHSMVVGAGSEIGRASCRESM